MNITFPFQIDNAGRITSSTYKQHIRQLIEQVLFTMPGERVNRPEFGSELMKMVFEPGSDQLAAANQMLVQAALQRWLSDLVQVESVDVTSQDNILTVTIQYIMLKTQEQLTEQFVSPV